VALPHLTSELIAEHVRTGAWQERPLVAVIDELALRTPEVLAVADQHEALTYAELVRRSSNLAAWLLEQGLEPGATVALQCGNRVALAVTHLACDRADLVFVPLSSSWRRAELTHLLSLARPEVVIVGPPVKGLDYVATVTELRPSLPGLRAIGGMDGVAAEFDYEAVCRTDRPLVAPLRDPNAPRYVMVTSGTTGAPHMSLWSDNDLWFFLSRYIHCVQLRSGDVAVGMAPASTGATGYVFPVLSPLLCGASGILLEHWDPTSALDLLESSRATHATAIPTQVLKLLADPSVNGRDFGSLRTFTNSGSAMPPDGARQLETVFGCTQHVVYGATDGGTPTMLCFDDPPDKRYTTVGKVYGPNEVRLVDTEMADVPAGQSGEILWRGPTKSYGYLNEPDRSEAVWYGDGWYRSGDLGSIDEDGYLSIVGRVKDLIIRGGQNISPREIEDLVMTLPEVADVAVVGVPDPIFGERVCACVILHQGASLSHEQLVERLRQAQVATFKLPEFLEVFDDFPKSTGGKVSKVELRRVLADRMPVS
jgi:non-ribosomal peptide synthetase component E (peptide arylation enzyme)